MGSRAASSTEISALITFTEQVAELILSALTVMVALPGFLPVITPCSLTSATEVLSDVKLTS